MNEQEFQEDNCEQCDGKLVFSLFRDIVALRAREIKHENLTKTDFSNINLDVDVIHVHKIFSLAGAEMPKIARFHAAYCDFNGSTFKESNIGNASFEYCTFKDASFRGADLRDARFHRCDFEPSGSDPDVTTCFNRANMQKAWLHYSDFSGCLMQKIAGEDIYLLSSKFVGTDLFRAELDGASVIEGCDFSSANLAESSFRYAKLWKAKFDKANLRGVDFTDGRLWKCDFTNTDLRDAIFDGASLENVDFKSANLEGAKFRLSNGRIATLKNVSFMWNTSLRNSEFDGCKLERVRFWADMTGSRVVHIINKGVDLLPKTILPDGTCAGWDNFEKFERNFEFGEE